MPTLAELWEQLTDRTSWPPAPPPRTQLITPAELAAVIIRPDQASDVLWRFDQMPATRERRQDAAG